MLAGYDQFAGCLPAPVGTALTVLLHMIPSPVAEGGSCLYDLRAEEGQNAMNRKGATCFIA